MKILVTGAAGFVGSHVVDLLLSQGHDVWGVDSFTPYYNRALKQKNLEFLALGADWRFEDRTVGSIDPGELENVDAIVHLAAQPGVRTSWNDWPTYLELNLNETNRLATSAILAGVPKVVFASSSSVYGDLVQYPTREDSTLVPRSPYGVTKQAGESLWRAHTMSRDTHVAALRFFTVYGPGQRPDMATQRLIRAALEGSSFTLFGTGEQRRDFTFVKDIAEACALACEAALPAGVLAINIGGSGDTSMNQLIEMVESATGRRIDIVRQPAERGDVVRTGADTSLAQSILGWSASTSLREGVERHVAYESSPTRSTWSVVS